MVIYYLIIGDFFHDLAKILIMNLIDWKKYEKNQLLEEEIVLEEINKRRIQLKEKTNHAIILI